MSSLEEAMGPPIENWRTIPGYRDYYRISDAGQVYSAYRGGRLLTSRISPETGYVTIFLIDLNGVAKNTRVHRLVALAYLPNPLALPAVNHKNGVKTDNSVLNLEWCDALHNSKHAIALGLRRPGSNAGEKNGRCKLSDNQVKEIRLLLAQGMRMVKIAAAYDVSPPQIRRIKLGKLRNQGKVED